MEKVEKQKIAKYIVDNTAHSFLDKESIIENFKDFGFLVSENKNIGYKSNLEYDKKNKRGILSFDGEISLKEQNKLLLINFCAFILDSNMHIKYYYKDIVNKSSLKDIARYVVDFSAEKEFSVDQERKK